MSGLEAGTAGKDAVNKDQLDSVQAGATQNTDALGNSTAANLGGGATYDSSTGALSAPSYITNDPTTGTANTASNVGDALDSLNTAVNKPLTFKDAASGSSINPLGSELAIVGDSNITTTVSQGQAVIALNKDISLDSVTAGNTVINGAGVTTDKVTVGNVTVDSSTNKISGLEAGTAGKDAVNKDQLDSVQAGATQNTDALGNSTAANLGGGATYDSSTGALSAPSYITNDPTTGTANTASNVGDALDSLNTAVNKPLTFKDAASGSSINPLGSELAIVGDSNITTTVSQGQAAIALNKDISLDSVTAGNTVINGAGVTTDKVTVGNVTVDSSTNKISGLEAGTAGKDAVNKDQLDSVQAGATQNTDALGNSTAANLGGGATYDSSTGALSAPSYITNDPTTGTANTASNVGDALDSLNTAVNKPLTFKDAASGSSINPLGSELAIVGDSNITTTVSQGQAVIALNKDISLDSVTAGNTVINGAGVTTDKVTVGNVTVDSSTNKISGLEAGTAGKDAVNKDQLDSVQAGATQNTDALGNSTAANLGGGATYDSSTGALSAPSYITNDPTTGTANTASNVGDALDSLNTAVNKPLTFKDAASGSSINPLGSELAIVGDSNITTTVSQGQAAIALNKDISLDSVTAGDSLLNTDGLTIVGGPSITKTGIDAAGNTISNVKDGVAGKDAVNKDQLDSVQAGATQNTDALGNSTAANLGGGATYDSSTGALSAPSYITNDPTTGTANTASNVGDALDSLNTAVNKPLTFKDAASGSSINPLGSELAIVGDSNITTTVSQGQAVIALNKDISLDSVTAGNTVINGAGVTTDKVTVGNVTVDSSTNKISGLEAGTAGKDAVNKDQLDSVQAGATQNTDALGNSTAANLGGGATYDSSTGALSAPSYITNDPTTGTANTASNVGDALDSLNTAVNKPLTFKDAASGSSTNPLGSELAIVGDSNITTTVSQGQAAIALNKDISLDSVTAGNTVINGAGVTTDKVTVGNVTVDSSTNKISGLEAGTAGKDAVNKDQLDSVQAGATQNTDALGNSTAANLGGGATYDSSTGALSAPSYITNDPTTGTANTASNVGDALDSLNTAVNKPLTFKDAASGSSINPLGSELAIVGDSNITTTVSQGQAVIALNKDISLDSVTAGNTVINGAGVTTDKVTVGNVTVDSSTNKISGLEAGTAGKDAVNKDQLDSVQAGATQNTDALGNSTAANLGGGATYDSSTGALSAPSYITNDPTTGTANTASNVGDALDSLNTAVNKPLTFKDAASGSSINPLGSELAIVGDSNITTTVSQGQAAIALNKDISLDSVTAGNTVINGAGVTTDKVTVGNVTVDSSTNKISGLEAGTAGKDAVNKDQLDSVQAGATQNTDALGNSTAANLGGGATYDSSTGALSAPSYITNDPTTGTANTASNVGDALDSLNTAVNKPLTFKDAASGSSINPLGSELAIVGDSNITTTVSQGQAVIALNKDISLDSVTAGNTVINGAGVTTDKVTVGNVTVDSSTNKISGLEAGTAGKDAVNKDQLDSVQAGATQNTDALGNSTAANLGGGATYDSSTGALSAPSYITNDPTTGTANTASNVGDALDSLNTAVNKPLTFKDAASGSSINPLGSELAIVGDSNITTTVSQGQAAIALNKDISLDSVTAGDSLLNTDGLTIVGGPSITKTGIDAAGNTISNVKDGVAGKDAVNKDQLDSVQAGATQNTDALGNSTAANLGGGATYDSSTGALSAPSYITNDPTTGTANTASNVGDALDSLNTAVNKPLTFKDAASGSSTNPLGSELAIVGDSNITTTVSQGQAAIALNKDISLDSVTAGNSLLNTDGLTIVGGPSITKTGIDAAGNTISNVKDGVAGKDAVNKDQLDSVQAGATQNTDALGNSTAANLGGGATYDSSTGALSAPSYITNDPTTGAANTASNVGDALDSLNTAVNKPLTFKDAASGSSTNPLGSELAIVGDSNITTTVSQGQAAIALNKDISLDSVTAGDSLLNTDGLTIVGGPSITKTGIDAAGNTISNVKDGVAGKDAVNKDQLDSVQAGATQNTDALGNSTAANLGGGATYDSSTGALSAPSYITNDPTTGTANTASNVGDALDSLNTAVNKPLTFKDAASGSSINPLGSELAIVGDSNITTTVSQGQAAIALNKDISLDSVTAGDSLLNTDGLTIVGGPSITKTGIDAAGNTISNVKDGVAGKDAVNKDQLDSVQAGATQNTDALGNSTAANLGGGATYDSSTGALSAPSYITNDPTTGAANTASNVGDALDSLNTAVNKPLTFKDAASGSSINPLGSELAIVGDSNITTTVSQGQAAIALNKDISLDSVTAGDSLLNTDGLTIVGGPSITKTGIDAAGNTISNVKDGVAGKDAVNKDQLDSVQAGATQNTDALGNSTAANLGGGATYDSSTGALSAPSYITNDPTTGAANTASNVGDALDSLNTAVNKPLTFKDAASGSSTNPLGSELAIVGDSNITTTVSQGQAAIALNKDLKGLTSVETTDGSGNTAIQTAAGTSVVDSTGNSTVYGANGTTITGANGRTVIITSEKVDVGGNTINNVADAINGKDAVNKDQLDSVKAGAAQNTDALGNSTANNLGGGATYDPSTGIISNPSYSVTSNPNDPTATTTVNNVGAALDSLNAAVTTPLMFTGDAGTGSSNVLGSTLEILGDSNITTTVDQGKAMLSLNKNINVDSVTAGASTLDNAGLTIVGGPSITIAGIDAGNKTITNVSNAINAGDAVNKGQMDAAIDKVSSDVNQIAANAVQYDSADKDSVTLGNPDNGPTGLHNVADGKLETGSKDAVNGGQLADVRDNLQGQINQNTSDITNIKNDVNSGAIGLVKQENPTADVTVAKDTGGTKVNVAGADGDRVVTGVANGAVNSTSTDAVNGSQLNTTNQAVVDYLGGGAGYNNITNSFEAPTYTVGDKDYNNVGGAVDALNQADQALNNKIDNVGNQLQDAFRTTNKRIDDVEKRANAGIAAALALEAAPYIPGKYTYAAGAAYHGGENAVGVTLRKTADNGRWSLTGGVSAASEGDPSVRIGISGLID
ncbi:YadA-like family protein [Acinetobacter sp. TGL-Y2]|uniref:YadA-like family protein n=1 Tax=Acinetobacter sp. TGL-Y2 TaxID=1407071 RepID=UPI002ADECCB7|nr:YadA-like family protein [Acinetobacter sp. TGL-Y2]